MGVQNIYSRYVHVQDWMNSSSQYARQPTMYFDYCQHTMLFNIHVLDTYVK